MDGQFRFKKLGTGSAVPAKSQVTERPRQFARTIKVSGLLTVATSGMTDPRDIATRGLPCFRFGGGSGYDDSSLEIMVQGNLRWQNLIDWWHNNAIGSDKELAALLAQVGINSGNWKTQTTPTMDDFIYCEPYVAGNVILHKRDYPHNIVATSNSPHLHVFRQWRTKSFYAPLTLDAHFDRATLDGIGSNRLTIFVERPSNIAVEWENPPPESWQDLIGYSGESEICVDDSTYDKDRLMDNNGHPWPDGKWKNATGVVAVSSRTPSNEIVNGFPAIPLYKTSQTTLTYLTSPKSFEGVLQTPPDGAVSWQPFHVWDNIDPIDPDVSDYTSLDPLISNAVDDPASRPGIYTDSAGNVVAVRYTNYAPGYTNSAETAESYVGYPVDRIGTVPIVRSDAETLPLLKVELSGETASITGGYLSRLVKIYRRFLETFVIPDGEGPELVVSIFTGSGKMSDPETDIATAAFACQGIPLILPANDAATRLINAGKVTLSRDTISGTIAISFPFSDEVEKDSSGFYYPFQTVEVRFRLAFYAETINEFLLYPTTAAIGAPKPIPDGPFIFNGYPFT